MEQLLNSINNLKKRTSRTLIHFYPNLTDAEIRRYYTDFNFKPSSYKHRCISPWMVAYIFPDGSVRPCQSLNYVAGNIKEEPLKISGTIKIICDSGASPKKTNCTPFVIDAPNYIDSELKTILSIMCL